MGPGGRGAGRGGGRRPRGQLRSSTFRHMAKRPEQEEKPRRGGRKDKVEGTHGLVRWISKFGFASRTEATRLVTAGRVTVDGRVERDPERRTDPDVEAIAVDGRILTRRQPLYLAMNKPAGAITTYSDELNRRTVYDFLPDLDGWVFPIGRLDAQTTGLLLFTNDTRLGDVLTNERYHVDKRYEALVEGTLEESAAARLERGIEIAVEERGRYVTRPARCQVLARLADPPATRIALTIREGKNRQVRKMLQEVGHPVLELKRTRIGPVALGGLPIGQTRPLAGAEIEALKRLVREADRRDAPPGAPPPPAAKDT
jgi:23S rRNA pseudouridine2605 synthase